MYATGIATSATIMRIDLAPHQLEAINRLDNGYILCGSVGSGKSRAAIAYYFFKVCGGDMGINDEADYKPMSKPRDLYIITTAKKRDNREWEEELRPFGLFTDNGFEQVKIVIDSWNNIKKYKDVTESFIIFDEQRVVGSGSWVKSFLNIARKNKWILLTATPGDKWDDYRAVFIANGFFKNKTEFEKKHCVFSPYVSYKKIDHYVDTGKLVKYRNQILIKMRPPRHTVRKRKVVICEYDKDLYKRVWKDRWDPYDNEPIAEQGKLGYLLRRVVNSDISRENELVKLLESIPKAIIFYNFNYELDIIRNVCDRMKIPYSEWNGQKHEAILDGDNWVYIVQYAAGAEGWNCITTDTIIFYSQNYSYKATEQASGRIDRMNTSFVELYYYSLRSLSPIDVAITRALERKENFNEKAFLGF